MRQPALYATELLRVVRDLVPHDRVNHLQLFFATDLRALPCSMPRQRRREQYSPHRSSTRARRFREKVGRFLSRLFPCRDADTDDADVTDWRFRGAIHNTMPACHGSKNRQCLWRPPTRTPFSVPLQPEVSRRGLSPLRTTDRKMLIG